VQEGRRQKAEGRRQKAEGRRQKAEGRRQKAEGRRQKAEGRRQESLYSKLFNLFQLDSYLCHAALVSVLDLDSLIELVQSSATVT
jgi:uncharacterized protein YjbJ (UPF0337 family)